MVTINYKDFAITIVALQNRIDFFRERFRDFLPLKILEFFRLNKEQGIAIENANAYPWFLYQMVYQNMLVIVFLISPRHVYTSTAILIVDQNVRFLK